MQILSVLIAIHVKKIVMKHATVILLSWGDAKYLLSGQKDVKNADAIKIPINKIIIIIKIYNNLYLSYLFTKLYYY
jgi:hypothetical protein